MPKTLDVKKSRAGPDPDLHHHLEATEVPTTSLCHSLPPLRNVTLRCRVYIVYYTVLHQRRKDKLADLCYLPHYFRVYNVSHYVFELP